VFDACGEGVGVVVASGAIAEPVLLAELLAVLLAVLLTALVVGVGVGVGAGTD
jgi:hypothetical protein